MNDNIARAAFAVSIACTVKAVSIVHNTLEMAEWKEGYDPTLIQQGVSIVCWLILTFVFFTIYITARKGRNIGLAERRDLEMGVIGGLVACTARFASMIAFVYLVKSDMMMENISNYFETVAWGFMTFFFLFFYIKCHSENKRYKYS